MPHNTSQWVSHFIDGGWATDYGTTLYSSPNNGEVHIPWCTTCENVRFKLDGRFGKYPGLQVLGSAPVKAPQSSLGYVEDSTVRHLYNYTNMGSSLTGTSQLVAIVGSYFYVYSGGEFVRIGDVASTSTKQHHFSTFNDLLVIGGPYSWDQSTFQALAGTPPAFQYSIPHAGRHWAAGVPSAPSRLYYSVVGNPEDWVGSGSGSIDIDPGDGDAIVGLLSWKRELWVFKGPHRLSIHRITGTDPSDFARVPFIYGISAAGQGSIFPMGEDFGFFSPRGSCHSLTSTNQYGDYSQAYINYPLLSWFRNPQNIPGGTLGLSWQTVTDPIQNMTYCVMNNNLLQDNILGFAFMMDWRFQNETNPYPRFIPLNLNRRFSSVSLAYSIFNTTQMVPVLGDRDGRLYQEYPEYLHQYRVNDYADTEAIPYTVTTPALTYGPSVYKKTITAVSIDVNETFTTGNSETGTLDFSYSGRDIPAQTLSFTLTAGAKLGSFILGTDQLGGAQDRAGYSDDVNGESRAFVYTLQEDSPLVESIGSNVNVRHFGVLLSPSGESLEN